jgi:hypothetical protein
MLPEGFSMRKRDKDAARENPEHVFSAVDPEGKTGDNYRDEFENDYDFGTRARKVGLGTANSALCCGLTASGPRRFPGRCPKQRSETP